MLAAYTTLVDNVVVAAIQEASTQAQIDATQRLIDSQAKSVQILEYQQAKGYASGVDLAAQRSQLAAAEATLPPLLKQKAQFHDQLAVLTGRFPSQAPAEKLALSGLQIAGRSAGQPSIGPGHPASRRAPGRGQSACGQRPDRHRRGQPIAQYSAHGGRRKHGIGPQSAVHGGNGILECRRGADRSHIQWRHAAAPGARGAGRL